MSKTDHPKADSSVIPFRADHLAVFEASIPDGLDGDESGMKEGAAFGAGLPGVDAGLLPSDAVTRSDVFRLAQALDVINEATVCAAAMAWGGMRLANRDRLFAPANAEWLDVARLIRHGLDRKAAYAEFEALRSHKDNRLPGAGPAFFSKFIYFLTPREDDRAFKRAYIMDQWAASSVNLLTDSDIVLMDVTRTWTTLNGEFVSSFAFTVSDANTSDDYERFCSAVDSLADRFDLTADEIDRALSSTGGSTRGVWRDYVVANRPRLVGRTRRLSWV